MHIRVTDTAGNSGTADTQLVTIDTTAPTTTLTIDSITDDTGVSTTDFITTDNNGLTIGATLSTALVTGEILEYSNDDGVTWTDITSSVSGTAISHVDGALTSTETVHIRVTDTAGNSGTAGARLVTKDTTAPTTTPTLDSMTDHTGVPTPASPTTHTHGLPSGTTRSTAHVTR